MQRHTLKRNLISRISLPSSKKLSWARLNVFAISVVVDCLAVNSLDSSLCFVAFFCTYLRNVYTYSPLNKYINKYKYTFETSLCFWLADVSCLNKDCVDFINLIKSQGLHNSHHCFKKSQHKQWRSQWWIKSTINECKCAKY